MLLVHLALERQQHVPALVPQPKKLIAEKQGKGSL
jgi:hypothetical protein